MGLGVGWERWVAVRSWERLARKVAGPQKSGKDMGLDSCRVGTPTAVSITDPTIRSREGKAGAGCVPCPHQLVPARKQGFPARLHQGWGWERGRHRTSLQRSFPVVSPVGVPAPILSIFQMSPMSATLSRSLHLGAFGPLPVCSLGR